MRYVSFVFIDALRSRMIKLFFIQVTTTPT